MPSDFGHGRPWQTQSPNATARGGPIDRRRKDIMTLSNESQSRAPKGMRRLRQFGGPAVVLALLLSGCGGSSDSGSGGAATGPAAAASVPESAYASTPAFMRFIAAMGPDDRSEPLVLLDRAAPTDDRGEPWDGVQ